MKADTHPTDYRTVVFEDQGTRARFMFGSTVRTSETVKVDGTEYPLYRVEISSTSHPFYTGVKTTIDRAGRVDRFKQKVAKSKVKKA